MTQGVLRRGFELEFLAGDAGFDLFRAEPLDDADHRVQSRGLGPTPGGQLDDGEERHE